MKTMMQRVRTVDLVQDQMLVIDGGRIIERGSHSALMAQEGFYYRLYSGQFTMMESDETQAGEAGA